MPSINVRKKLPISLVILLFIIIAGLLTAYSRMALNIARDFCEKHDISCSDFRSSFSLTDPGILFGYINGPIKPRIDPRCGDLIIHFSEGHGTHDPISFIINRQSREIETFSNRYLYYSLRGKYGIKDWKSKEIAWPPLMSERDATLTIDAIANKLNKPGDMVLQSLKMDDKKGIWTATWWRELHGYQYEKDRMSISIMGATGEFIEYYKTSEGSPCPTEVRLSEQEILTRGWNRFIAHLPESLRGKAHTLYNANASLRIIQPNVLGWLPIKTKKSRLAWIVIIYFTGGFDYKQVENPSDADLEVEATALTNRVHRWHELDRPPRSYEVRYDAATGEILADSGVMPSFLRGLMH